MVGPNLYIILRKWAKLQGSKSGEYSRQSEMIVLYVVLIHDVILGATKVQVIFVECPLSGL